METTLQSFQGWPPRRVACPQGSPLAGWAAYGSLLPLWTPHAVRICIWKSLGKVVATIILVLEDSIFPSIWRYENTIVVSTRMELF
jgi:hypothetical protein